MELPPPIPRTRKFALSIRGVLAVCLGVGGVWLVRAHAALCSEWVTRLSPGCIFRRFTGIKCPGCGGTRALKALLEGNIVEAFHYNLYWLPCLFMLLLLFAMKAFNITHESHPRFYCQFYLRALKCFSVITILWFILRNVFDC